MNDDGECGTKLNKLTETKEITKEIADFQFLTLDYE